MGFLPAALDRLHEPLGGIAAIAWGLPSAFARVIATHHRSPVPTWRDPLSETIYLTERLDIAMRNGTRFDIEDLWTRGGLTTPFEVGRPLVEQAARTAVETALAKGENERERAAAV